MTSQHMEGPEVACCPLAPSVSAREGKPYFFKEMEYTSIAQPRRACMFPTFVSVTVTMFPAVGEGMI